MMSTTAHIPPARSVDVLTGIIIFVVLVFTNRYVESAYDHYRVIRGDGSQSHYESEPLNRGTVVYWAELGRDARVSNRVGANRLLTFENLHPADYWQREVYWSFRTNGTAALKLNLDPVSQEGLQVGIFIVDGNTYHRIGVGRSGEQTRIFDDLHDGRWFWFDVTEEELARLSKEITIIKLMGSDVAIAGLVIVAPAS